MKILFINDRTGGPFIIQQLEGKFFPICLNGFEVKNNIVGDSENECFNILKRDFGEFNTTIETYENFKDGIWALYAYLVKPSLIKKLSNYISIRLTTYFGFGYTKVDYSILGGTKCFLHNIQIAFFKLSIGQVKSK